MAMEKSNSNQLKINRLKNKKNKNPKRNNNSKMEVKDQNINCPSLNQ